MPLLYCLINFSSTNSAISPYYSFDYCFQHIYSIFSFFVFLGHVDWISCISPLYFPYILSSFYCWVLMMSVHISHFSLVFDLPSIAVNNICNCGFIFSFPYNLHEPLLARTWLSQFGKNSPCPFHI